MPLDEQILRNIQTGPARLILKRHFHPDQSLDPLSGRPNSGRWATASGTLYAADATHVAWAEYCRCFWHDIDAAAPITSGTITVTELARIGSQELQEAPIRTIYEIEVDLTLLADLTTPVNRRALQNAGFPLNDFFTNDPATGILHYDYGQCPEVAGLGERLGWEALRAPSAAWPVGGHTIAIFSSGKSSIVRCDPVFTGRPTVAMAVATRYRNGQKPSWVP